MSDQGGYAGHWHAVITAAVDAIIVIDEKGEIESCNPAADQLFGYEPDELVGCHVTVLMPSPYREEHDGYMKNYLQTGQAKIIGIGRDVVARRKDGTVFPIHLRVGEFRSEGKRGFVGLIHDIRDREEAERELRSQRNELERVARISVVGEMASTLAHEINQPLTAIANYARALKHTLGAEPPKERTPEDILVRIDAQVERAATILRRVRAFLSEDGRVDSRFEVHELLEETLRLVEPDAAQHGAQLRIRPDSAQPSIVSDRVRLQQILVNLLRNAIDAVVEAGTLDRPIHLYCKDFGDRVVVSVEDRGCGISPDHERKLFVDFFTTKTQGMGFGLRICRSIAEDLGGGLWFSRNLDGGVTFHISLPDSSR